MLNAAPHTVDLDVDLGTELCWSGSGEYTGPVYTIEKWGILSSAFKMMKHFMKVNTKMAPNHHFGRPKLDSKPHFICLHRLFTLD